MQIGYFKSICEKSDGNKIKTIQKTKKHVKGQKSCNGEVREIFISNY